MRAFAYAMRAVGALAVATLFGCGGSATETLGGMPRTVSLAVDPSGAVRSGGPMRPDRGKSWMLPSATSCVYNGKLPPCGLLYVSSYYTNDVFVFKNNALVGKLTGFNAPDGVCTDKSGNVWITNNRGQSIVEYAHGGSTPIKTLSDPGVYPLGCAVNPRTGAIAVTNVFTTGSGQGNVAIYHKASGKPLILTDPDIYDVYFCGFDAQSNLYIDGLDTSGNFEFAELPRDRFKFESIALDEKVYWPGAIQWDGTYVVVGDQLYQDRVASAAYQTTGSGGEIVGTTVFSGAQDVVGFYIEDGSVVGPDANLNALGLYMYPSGGDPTVLLHNVKAPYGAAISVAR